MQKRKFTRGGEEEEMQKWKCRTGNAEEEARSKDCGYLHLEINRFQ